MNEILEPGGKLKIVWPYIVGMVGALLFSAVIAGAMLGLGWLFYDGHIGIRGWNKNFQWANQAIGIAIWVMVGVGSIVGGVSQLSATYRSLRKRLGAAETKE